MTSLKQALIEHCNDVIQSDFGHCQKEKWACMRFLRDIEREGTEAFPYRFNEDKAMRFLKWMTNFKHTKGELAGQFVDPAPIQIFIFSNVYGWEHMTTGYRRFRRAYWQVARKNAKTQSLAMVASYEASALGEPFSEVYIGATQTAQAKILWNECQAQINRSTFADKFMTSYGRIRHIKSNSFIEALSKEARKSGDGFNPQAGLIDEYHAHPTSELPEVIESGQNMRTQPLLFFITTAGFNLQHPCYSVEYQYVSRILNPDDPTEVESYFCMVNELDFGDDIKDERNWIKANPIVATTDVGMSGLRAGLRDALNVPEMMRNFVTKNMNMWVDMPEAGYMDLSKWREASADDFDDFAKDGDVYLGIDLSLTTDLTSIGLVAKQGDSYRVKQVSFMPEDKYQERITRDKVRFDLFKQRGELVLCRGAVVDYGLIREYVLNFCKQYKIQEVCYDKWNASLLVSQLEQDGLLMVEIDQSVRGLSEATKDFRASVYANKLKHNGDMLLNWAMGNVKLEIDSSENIKPSKKRSSERIDPVAAIMNAYARAMHNNRSLNLNNIILSEEWGL